MLIGSIILGHVAKVYLSIFLKGLHVIPSLCDSESEEDELISLSLSGINLENVDVRGNDQ